MRMTSKRNTIQMLGNPKMKTAKEKNKCKEFDKPHLSQNHIGMSGENSINQELISLLLQLMFSGGRGMFNTCRSEIKRELFSVKVDLDEQ